MNSVAIKLVTESVFAQANIDRENKKINNVSILGMNSRNNRRYTDKAFETALSALDGVPAYYRHSEKSRDLKGELIGNFTGIKKEGDRIRGTLNVLAKESDFVFEIAERMPSTFGFSIDADVKYRKIEGIEVIEEIIKGRSVDLVSDPATVKGLFEEKTMEDKNKMEELEKIKAENQKLTEEIKHIKESQQKEQLKAETEEIKKLREDYEKLKAEKIALGLTKEIEKEIQESKVPSVLITPALKKVLESLDKEGRKVFLGEIKSLAGKKVSEIINHPAKNFNSDLTITDEEIEKDLELS